MNQRVTYPLFIVMFSQLCAMDQGNFVNSTSLINAQDFERLVAHAFVFFQVDRDSYSEPHDEQKSADDTTPIVPLSNTQALTEKPQKTNNHIRTLFQCRFGCKHPLQNISSLNKHERTFHPEYATHKCATCNSVFFSEKGLNQHYSKQHGLSYIFKIYSNN